MKKILRFIKDMIWERKWLKSKPCAACENFTFYMGSAGICFAKDGCPATRLKDYSDTCDCGSFKKKKEQQQ